MAKTNIPMVNIGGLPLSAPASREVLVNELLARLADGLSPNCVSANAEILYLNAKTNAIADVLRAEDLCIPDGIGAVWAMGNKGVESVSRLPGCELWENLMAKAKTADLPVYLVGAKPDVLEQTVTSLRRQYSTPIVGAQHGYFQNEDELIQDIVEKQPKIVTVALGAPKQEKFIEKCRLKGVKAIFMGVGGTYDVYSGNLRRAPEIWRRLNLEWLYRLAQQPSRIGRYTVLAKFAWSVLRGKV